MGLDGVGLVMEVEDQFKISIPDEDAEQIQTVGQLYRYILKRCGQAQNNYCLSRLAFYRLRRALITVAGVDRASVSPKADLALFVPRRQRKALWKRLADESQLRLPELQRPFWPQAALQWTLLFFGIVSFFVWGAFVDVVDAAVLTASGCLLVGIAGLLLVELLTRPFANHFGPGLATVGGLAKEVMWKNYEALAAEQGVRPPVQDLDAWEKLRGIISEQLGVPLDQITFEASFVKDLGMG
jgi:acyl carrier protein